MKKLLLTLILVFSAVVHTAPLTSADQKTKKYSGNLSADQHDQNSVNNPSGKHGNQHLKDSALKRNSPGGEYHERRSKRNNSGSNVTDPHRGIVEVPLLSW
jgi:hypothetical protein